MARHTKRGRPLSSGCEVAPGSKLLWKVLRGITVILSLCALLAIGLATLGGGAPLQTETTAQQTPAPVPTQDPPGTIDGAKNPELIPDEVALRMIVLAVAEPPDATDEMKERARSKLNPIGLDEDDAIAFLALLSEFQGQAEDLDEQANAILVRAPIPHTASTDYSSLVEIGRQRDQILSNAVAAIPVRLSAQGLERLMAYLPQAKRGMKVMP